MITNDKNSSSNPIPMFITPSLLLIAFSILMAIMLIPAILFTKEFQKATKKMMGDENMVRMGGLISLVFAFLFLSVHWKFTGEWFIIIPIIGWLAFIKGVIRIWAPKFVKKATDKFMKSEAVVGLMAFVGLLVAIGLTYVALYIY
jgi:hypothetical protein